MPQPQPSAPKVTVAIPTYNRAAFLRQTLAGIAAQRFPREAFEVLVIDNNSTDNTRAVVAEFAGERPAPRCIVENRQGLDFARNRSVAEARGEIIVFVHAFGGHVWVQLERMPFNAERVVGMRF